ncbi:MAG: hypothetical protein RL536_9 [Candidatus Parcubacteria bacterium]|jgi:protein-disulfide isomerase
MDSRPNPLTIPGAIIIASAILAVAIIYVKKPATTTVEPATPAKEEVKINLAPITADDHILGNPNAPVRIVEFSDPSCPFCKVFHPTMKSLMDQYGPTGKVAWVYRAFPLDKPDSQGRILHPNAGHESQAFECAAALGGNDAFWKYTNRLYEITPSVTGNNPTGLDQKELPNIAKFAGLDVAKFNECLLSGRFKDKVEKQYLDGVNAGVSGTPSSILVLSKPAPATVDAIVSDLVLKLRVPIVVSDDRTKIFMPGALPVEALKSVIEAVLAV